MMAVIVGIPYAMSGVDEILPIFSRDRVSLYSGLRKSVSRTCLHVRLFSAYDLEKYV
jgi:hypothetical protein